MKKLRKLWAVLLAIAMLLSLSVTALADDDDDEEEETPATEQTFTDLDSASDTGRTIDATGTTQGRLPEKPISIILPTIPERVAGTMQMFDFILDPHSLIKTTNAAAYAVEEGQTAPTFDPDTRMFFASPAGSDYTYSGASKSLKVVNNGFMPLNVDLNLTFDRGGYTDENEVRHDNAFKLVSAANALKTGANATEAEMYLGIVNTEGATVAVADPADTTPSAVVAGETYTSAATFTVEAFDAGDEEDEDAVAALLAAYNAAMASLEAALPTASITLQYLPADSEADPAREAALVAVTVAGLDDFTVDGDDDIDAVDETDGEDVSITISADGALLATVAFNVKADMTGTEAGAEQAISFSIPQTGAKVQTALGVLADSYAIDSTTGLDEDAVAALTASDVDITPDGYYYKKVEADDTLYPAFVFSLVGNINDHDAWDAVLNTAADDDSPELTGITFDMTWDISEWDNTRTLRTAPAPAGPVQSNPPTVTLADPATGTGTTTKYAYLDFTAGTGTYENYAVTGVKNGAGKAISFAMENGQVKLTATTTNKTNANCVVTLSDAGGEGEDITVNITGWYTGT